MPAYSSHILQPLDVGCFHSLKQSYGREIEKYMRLGINHIQKEDFFTAFRNAFFASFGEGNVREGFRGAGLVLFNPETVISQLNIKFRTPSPAKNLRTTPDPWTSKTPQTAYEATSQSDFIKGRIVTHQNSSPTTIYEAMDQMAKGAATVMHKMVLIKDRIRELENANRTLSKRRRQKKTRIRQGGSLNVRDAQTLLPQNVVVEQSHEEVRTDDGRKQRVESTARRCGTCGKPGHNARTCQEDVIVSDINNSD